MARRTVVALVDDIDGGEASETVSFGLGGRTYEIDLSRENAGRLREALAPYVEAGRRRRRPGGARRRSAAASGPAAVRAWARSHGVEVPPRGRIPKRVHEAFNEARRRGR